MLSQRPSQPDAYSFLRSGLRSGSAALTGMLALAYPITTHVAIARRSPLLTLLAIVLLSAIVMIPWLLSGRLLAWATLPLVAIGCWLLSDARLALLPLYLPPIMIPAAVGWLFGQTLLAGRMPLIEQFLRAMERSEQEPAPAVLSYARQLTSVWSALLFSLALINLLLAAFAAPQGLLLASGIVPPVTVPQEAWSWFANCIAYLVIAVFFVVEFAFRRRRFPQQPYSFISFVRRTIEVSPRVMRRAR